jgi:hypothetical protein
MPRLFSGDTELAESKSGRLMRAMAPEQTEAQLLSIYSMIVSVGSGLAVDQGITIGDVVSDLHAGDRRARAWEDYIATAERHNSPGDFTTLIGWEWSSQTGGGNLHRVVFTPADGDTAARFQPFSTLESDNPEDLWAWLEKTSEATGADFIAIPHNPNLSLGKMFPLLRHNGKPVDADYGRRILPRGTTCARGLNAACSWRSRRGSTPSGSV